MAEFVTAPLVGKVFAVQCKVGDAVKKDQIIFLLEAMEMEVPVFAPVAGAIQEIPVSPGQTVNSDTVLAVIE